MSTLAIELTDSGIVIANDQGVIVDRSPGYAHLEGTSLLVGKAAQARSRLNPRRSLNDFWDKLGTDPLPRPFPDQLTQADLVHRHLEELSKQTIQGIGDDDSVEGVLLAVPGSFLTWQLGLMLGIARSAGLPVSGMVDSALCAAAGHSDGDRALHLEILLHRFVWTEIDGSTGLIRRRVEESGAVGLSSLYDAWAKLIADQFVRSTRFDPLHNAASEQALYDSLPDWLEALKDNDTAEASLEYGGQEYTIHIVRSQVVSAVEDQLRTISDLARALTGPGVAGQVLLSAVAATIPGLKSRLAESEGAEVVELPTGAAAAGALSYRADIEADEDELPFVIRLDEPGGRFESVDGDQVSTIGGAEAEPKRRPTHLVYGGMAYPIDEQPFWLGIALDGDQPGLNLSGNTAGISRSHCHIRRQDNRVLIEDHSTYGTFLNERPIRGSGEAEAGDLIRLGSPGIEIPLIVVLESDG